MRRRARERHLRWPDTQNHQHRQSQPTSISLIRATRGSYCLTSAALSTSGEGSPPAAPLPCSATPPMAFFRPSSRPIAARPRVRPRVLLALSAVCCDGVGWREEGLDGLLGWGPLGRWVGVMGWIVGLGVDGSVGGSVGWWSREVGHDVKCQNDSLVYHRPRADAVNYKKKGIGRVSGGFWVGGLLGWVCVMQAGQDREHHDVPIPMLLRPT